MATTNDSPIEALRAVYEAATPGPWEVRDGMNVKGASSLHVATTMGSETPRRDARAIAVTHNVMPELLAVVRVPPSIRKKYTDLRSSHRCEVVPGTREPCECDWCTWVDALDALDAKLAEVLR